MEEAQIRRHCEMGNVRKSKVGEDRKREVVEEEDTTLKKPAKMFRSCVRIKNIHCKGEMEVTPKNNLDDLKRYFEERLNEMELNVDDVLRQKDEKIAKLENDKEHYKEIAVKAEIDRFGENESERTEAKHKLEWETTKIEDKLKVTILQLKMELEETKIKLKFKHNSEANISGKLKYNMVEGVSSKAYYKLRKKYKKLKESMKSNNEVVGFQNLLMNQLNQSNNDVKKGTQQENEIRKLEVMVKDLTEQIKDIQSENIDLKYQIKEEEDLAKIKKKSDNEIAEQIKIKYEDTINNLNEIKHLKQDHISTLNQELSDLKLKIQTDTVKVEKSSELEFTNALVCQENEDLRIHIRKLLESNNPSKPSDEGLSKDSSIVLNVNEDVGVEEKESDRIDPYGFESIEIVEKKTTAISNILDVTEDEFNDLHKEIGGDMTMECGTKGISDDVITDGDDTEKNITNIWNQNNHKQITVPDISRSTVTKCHLCNQYFRDMEFLKKHITNEHTGQHTNNLKLHIYKNSCELHYVENKSSSFVGQPNDNETHQVFYVCEIRQCKFKSENRIDVMKHKENLHNTSFSKSIARPNQLTNPHNIQHSNKIPVNINIRKDLFEAHKSSSVTNIPYSRESAELKANIYQFVSKWMQDHIHGFQQSIPMNTSFVEERVQVFFNDIKESYMIINGSLHGIQLNEDNKMSIARELEREFDLKKKKPESYIMDID